MLPSLFPQRPHDLGLGTTYFFSARRPPRNFGSQPATGPEPKMMLQLDRKNLDMCHNINVLGLGGALDPIETPYLFQNKGRQVLVLMICEFFVHVPRKLWGL